MQNVTIGEFKAHFSHLPNLVKQGEELVISYGRKKEKVAVVIPYRRESDGDEILTLTAGS